MKLSIKDTSGVSLKVGAAVVNIGSEEYTGPYEFTPGPQAQTVPIEGQKATADITINPIPSNYGLVTWDGAVLTVS